MKKLISKYENMVNEMREIAKETCTRCGMESRDARHAFREVEEAEKLLETLKSGPIEDGRYIFCERINQLSDNLIYYIESGYL